MTCAGCFLASTRNSSLQIWGFFIPAAAAASATGFRSWFHSGYIGASLLPPFSAPFSDPFISTTSSTTTCSRAFRSGLCSIFLPQLSSLGAPVLRESDLNSERIVQIHFSKGFCCCCQPLFLSLGHLLPLAFAVGRPCTTNFFAIASAEGSSPTVQPLSSLFLDLSLVFGGLPTIIYGQTFTLERGFLFPLLPPLPVVAFFAIRSCSTIDRVQI